MEAFLRQDWDEVERLMEPIEGAVLANETYNARHHHRKYEINRVYQHHSEAHQFVTLAIANRDGAEAGIAYADEQIARLNAKYPGKYLDAETGMFIEDNPLVAARMMLAKVAALAAADS